MAIDKLNVSTPVMVSQIPEEQSEQDTKVVDKTQPDSLEVAIATPISIDAVAKKSDFLLNESLRAYEFHSQFDDIQKGSKASDSTPSTSQTQKQPEVENQKVVQTEDTSSSSDAASIKKTLIKGNKGSEVKTMQTELNKWRSQNGLEPIEANGNFNAKTEEAVKQFQEANGLKADGKFGPISRNRMTLENDPKFQQQPDDIKTKAREAMNQWSDPKYSTAEQRQKGRKTILDVVTGDEFNKTKSTDAKQNVLLTLKLNASTPKMKEQTDYYLNNQLKLENDPIFQNLSASKKKNIEQTLGKYFNQREIGVNGEVSSADTQKQDGLVFLATNPNFTKQSPAVQDELLKHYKDKPTWDTQTRNSMTISTQGFDKADDSTKSQILGILNAKGRTDQDAIQLNLLLESPTYNSMSPQQQRTALDLYIAMHPTTPEVETNP